VTSTAYVCNGSPTWVGTVDSDGGTIQLGSVTVEVPPGAVGPSAISLSATLSGALPGPLPTGVQPVGQTIVLQKSDPALFQQPVRVMVPYTPGSVPQGSVPVVYTWDDAIGQFNMTTMASIDEADGRLSFVTTHFSDKVPGGAPSVPGPVNTSYQPSSDGWAYVNFGSYVTTPAEQQGNCGGMSALSLFYYHRGLHIFPTVNNQGTTELDDDLVTQELITRAQKRYLDLWDRWFLVPLFGFADGGIADGGIGSINLSDEETGDILRAILAEEGPTVIRMSGEDASHNPVAHVGVVYKYDVQDGSGLFYFYDPNFPGCSASTAPESAPKIRWVLQSDNKTHNFEPYNVTDPTGTTQYTFTDFFAFAPEDFWSVTTTYGFDLSALNARVRAGWGADSVWAATRPVSATDSTGKVLPSGDILLEAQSTAKIVFSITPSNSGLVQRIPAYVAWRTDHADQLGQIGLHTGQVLTEQTDIGPTGKANVGPFTAADLAPGDSVLHVYLSYENESKTMTFDVASQAFECTQTNAFGAYAGYAELKVHVCGPSQVICGDTCCDSCGDGGVGLQPGQICCNGSPVDLGDAGDAGDAGCPSSGCGSVAAVNLPLNYGLFYCGNTGEPDCSPHITSSRTSNTSSLEVCPGAVLIQTSTVDLSDFPRYTVNLQCAVNGAVVSSCGFTLIPNGTCTCETLFDSDGNPYCFQDTTYGPGMILASTSCPNNGFTCP
jgi:hypothetical protein